MNTQHANIRFTKYYTPPSPTKQEYDKKVMQKRIKNVLLEEASDTFRKISVPALVLIMMAFLYVPTVLKIAIIGILLFAAIFFVTFFYIIFRTMYRETNRQGITDSLNYDFDGLREEMSEKLGIAVTSHNFPSHKIYNMYLGVQQKTAIIPERNQSNTQNLRPILVSRKENMLIAYVS